MPQREAASRSPKMRMRRYGLLDGAGHAAAALLGSRRALRGDRNRRGCPRRRAPHCPRRRPHPRVHAGRDEGDRQEPPPGRGARGRGAHPARQHLPPALPAGRGAGRGARRTARVHGLERADPDRLRRLPGLLAPRHDRRRRRRGRHVPVGLRRDGGPVHAGVGRTHPGAARLRHRDVPRRLPACRRLACRGRGSRPPDDDLGDAPA